MKALRTGILLALAARHLPGVAVEQYHWRDFTFSAQTNGNPFDVDLRAEFTGPGGVQLTVPGFYDGANTWKIRFSPTATGRWTMRTSSPVAALNGRTETDIDCTANTSPAVHGGLVIDPLNRHHFMYEDGARYFLMGYEADFLWAVDMRDPDRKVMHHLIDQIAGRGFNHLLVNVFAWDTSWAKGRTNQWDYGPPEMFVFGGTNEKPDFTRLNTDFFKKYDGMMQTLQERGIVAHVMFKVFNKLVNWPPEGSKDDERYLRYVTARYQGFSNIVWDYAKEAYYNTDKSQEKRIVDLIRSTDTYHRLMTVHDNDLYDWDPSLSSNLDFRTDQEHQDWREMIAFDLNLRQWPEVNSELFYERGVDNLPTYPRKQDWQEVIDGAYGVYLSGAYFVYYYSNTAWDLVKPDPEPPGMKPLRILQENLSALPYWKMTPKPELAAGGLCLAIPGQVYAFYVHGPRASGPALARGSAREIVTNLTGLTGPAAAQWINAWTGDRRDQKIERPGVYQFNRPDSFGDAPALLIVRAGQ